MKKHFQILHKGLIILFLLSAGLTVFSQVRGLKARNDTVDVWPGIPVVYDILSNDSIPQGDTIRAVLLTRISGEGNIGIKKVHDASWQWTFTFSVLAWGGTAGDNIYAYKIYNQAMDTSSARILIRVHDKSSCYLDINNVSALFHSSGNHFFKENAAFEVPKGSGKTSLFSNTMWVGGKDGQGQIHFAGERFRQGPIPAAAGTKPDFYSGPIMDSTKYSVYTDTVWNYIWNLKQSEIQYHKVHYTDPGYKPIHDILTWPGNGDPALGMAATLAPFHDWNENGSYEPMGGDYPVIRGDQALFFIFNDDRGPHLESLGAKLRIEIHGMAYAFDMPNDSALKNTVFLNYRFYNRSQNTYDSTMFGIFSDIDLGYPMDDYVGCDVERNMYFGYNGTPIDGTGQPYAYGANPPTQSVTLLGGPYMDADGLDNPRYELNGMQLCDFSVNGINFGDTVVDNERYGLQRFFYINNSNAGVPSYMQDPDIAPDYYNMMIGKWKDGSSLIYGGNGHALSGGYGPECRFMFPGESDSLNWGVGCAPPNGPVYWAEETALNNPSDRRGVGITGPITFKPGDIQDIDLAFTWARDYAGKTPLTSLAKLRYMTDIVNKVFTTNTLPNGNPFNGIADQSTGKAQINVYPNPSGDYFNITFGGKEIPAGSEVALMTSQGDCLKKIAVNERLSQVRIDLSGVPAGFYLIRVATEAGTTVRKAIVIHP